MRESRRPSPAHEMCEDKKHQNKTTTRRPRTPSRRMRHIPLGQFQPAFTKKQGRNLASQQRLTGQRAPNLPVEERGWLSPTHTRPPPETRSAVAMPSHSHALTWLGATKSQANPRGPQNAACPLWERGVRHGDGFSVTSHPDVAPHEVCLASTRIWPIESTEGLTACGRQRGATRRDPARIPWRFHCTAAAMGGRSDGPIWEKLRGLALGGGVGVGGTVWRHLVFGSPEPAHTGQSLTRRAWALRGRA